MIYLASLNATRLTDEAVDLGQEGCLSSEGDGIASVVFPLIRIDRSISIKVPPDEVVDEMGWNLFGGGKFYPHPLAWRTSGYNQVFDNLFAIYHDSRCLPRSDDMSPYRSFFACVVGHGLRALYLTLESFYMRFISGLKTNGKTAIWRHVSYASVSIYEPKPISLDFGVYGMKEILDI